MTSETASVILGALTLVTLVINAIIQWLRDGRNRRWEIEDRRIRFDKVERKIEENTQLTLEAHQKIDENTQVSVEAFKEANEINAKIAAIGEVRQRGSNGTKLDRKP